LRNDLVDRLTESDSFHWDQLAFLVLLLNTQTKCLILDKCKKNSIEEIHHELLPLVSLVVFRAPNLEFLSFSGKIEYPAENIFLADGIKTQILNQIVHLKNLKHLSLFGYFLLDSEDLMLVAKNLQKLICLKV